MKKAVGYCRVSTDGQMGDDKFGIDSQKQQIIEYADKHNYEITEWFIDEGISGAKEKRPAFDEIIYGELKNPPIESVIVAKNDRVARDINIYFYYKMMLKKKNIQLISISEDFGQFGVFSNMLEAFTLCVAEMERENINKRTSMGRGVKAKKGGYAGGQAPYGYKVVDKQLVVVPDEAEAIKDIFKMHDDGATLKEIADEMNSRGLTTHRGGQFRTSTIQVIVGNRKTYEGYYKYGTSDWVEGQHEAILIKE